MAGTAISRVTGRGVYVPGNDIDTDRIIPARFLKCVTFDELGPSLFYDVRFDANGSTKGHPLDAEQHQGAAILIADDNFGCGSSREHAPQAIQKFGLQAIIAGSFAEIFHGNCTSLGIPCLAMANDERQRLAAAVAEAPQEELILDLAAEQVIFANNTYKATMKKSAREALLAATYDPLDELLAVASQVKETAARLGY
ncbi:MAG: 3-isopropylmalate dehydratase small subunit [Pseudomonadales bacterium]